MQVVGIIAWGFGHVLLVLLLSAKKDRTSAKQGLVLNELRIG